MRIKILGIVAALLLAIVPNMNVSAASERKMEATTEEIDLMARCVMSEAGNQSLDCKIAVAETIVNRTLSDDPIYPDTITDVIKQRNQYSTAYNGDITQECYDAVYMALSQKTYDENLLWFRTGHYHKYGDAFIQIDDTYFSIEREEIA